MSNAQAYCKDQLLSVPANQEERKPPAMSPAHCRIAEPQ